MNPVKDNYKIAPEQWSYSSYNTIISNGTSVIKKKEILDWFDGVENFIFCHKSVQFTTREVL